jgi:quercetin dioxygenase-like cupin family protein
MNTEIEKYVQNTDSIEWKPLSEPGIETSGIFVKVLRYDAKLKRSPTIMLKFEPGARYPYHNHPGGEELFVLQGSCILEGVTLNAADYLYTPPGCKHSVTTETGCILLFVVPEEVEIL